MNHRIHGMKILTLASLGMLLGSAANAATVTATTDAFRLSIKHDGIRQSAGNETLTYSNLWDGGDGAAVTIAQDGAVLVEGLTGEGERAWSVTRNGTYVLTHTTFTNGVAGKVETATFVVTGKDVPFSTADVTVSSYSNKYDGAAHGIDVTVADGIAGAVVKYATAVDGEFVAAAPTLTDVGSMTVWCEITAPGYITQTNSATVTITKRAVTLTSGSDSKTYDGTALTKHDVTVGGDGFAAGEGASYEYTGSQMNVGTSENAFTYTLNEGTKAGNYEISTLNGTLTVTKATVGPGSGGGEPGGGEVPQGGISKFDATFVYDGEGRTIDTNALVAAFGAAMIGESVVEYALDDGSGESGHAGRVTLPWLAEAPVYTNAGEYVVWYRVTNPNYEDFVHAAKLTITKATVTEPVIDDVPYSGVQCAAEVPESDLYDVTYNAGGVNVGSYMVMLQLTDSANWAWATTGADYVLLWYNIVPAANGWIVEPSITGWTYGEAVGTPRAEARFGTVSVTYNGTADDGTAYANASAVTKSGTYTAVFTVTATESYGALSAEVPFTVSPRPINPPGGGGEGGASLYVTSYAGVYDGEGHGIGVEARDAGDVVFTVEYARDATGPWSADMPLYTNVVSTSVWYRVSAPSYAPFSSFTSVTITKRPVTVSVAGRTATYTYDGTEKTVTGYDAATEDALYDVAANTVYNGSGAVATQEATVKRTDAGTSQMELAAGDFANGNANFTVTYLVTDGWVKIEPRSVTLTSGSASKAYDGTALTKHEVTVGGDGFAAGEGASYAYTGSQMNVGTSENTFTYALNEGTKAGNYDISTSNGTLTVTKATVGGGEGGGDEPGTGEAPQGGISKFDATFVYDGEGHTIDTDALAAAFGEAMIGESAVEYALDDGSGESGHAGRVTLPWLAEAPVYTNVGEYVVWYRVTNPNYDDFVHAAKLAITNRPVTVTVTGHTAAYDYDTTEKTVTGYDVSTEDALYDIAADTAFNGAALATRTDVGTTAMGLTAADFANNNANFLVTYDVTDGWVKIEPRVIGDDPGNWDIRLARNPMYDGTEQSAPITQVAFVKPDGNLDNIPYTLSGNTATDAGNYVVRITGTGNYAGTVEKEWAITPRNVALTSGSSEWTYDGTAHSETAISVTGDGFADGEGASYSGFPVVRHVADAAEPSANTFVYTLNANTKAQNYAITTAYGTVKMTPRAITLTSPTKSKNYDGLPLTFGAEEIEITEPGHAGRVPLPNGETFTYSNFASITEAGRVDATFTVADGTALMGDYAITTVPGTLTVMKSAAEITVTAKSGSWVYDGQPHALHEYDATNAGVLKAGDDLEVTFSDSSVVTTPIDGEAQNGIVPNVIASVRVIRNGSTDVTANYTLAPYNGTLAVTRRPVVLTSKSAAKPYDGRPLTAHEVTVGGSGFVGEDGATYSFTGSQTEKGTSKNTFAYTLKSGTNAAYYEITKTEGDLSVTALDISGEDEGEWQVVLGPALTYTGLEQIQTLASVTYKGLPLDYSVAGNMQTDAGSYTMTLTGQGNFSGEHQVAWSIAPKALTLTAGSGSRVYDGTAFTVGAVTASGFVAGEGAEYTCDGSQKDVGSSANEVGTISWNANTKASNYAVTKVAGTLTVTPRPVTLTAANLSKPYDGTPLALTEGDITVALTGGALGDRALPNGESFVFGDFASRTEAGQTPATFSYAAGPGTSLANYAVTVTAGRMITITKSATTISVTAASESWVYDAEAHSNRTWTATNLSTLQSGDELEVTFDESSVVTTPQDGPAHDGVVPNVIISVRVLRGTEDVTANYSVEWFPGTLTVTKRPVTVTVTGHTATYTYDGEKKTMTGCDATTEDELYDVAASSTCGGALCDRALPGGVVFDGVTAVRTDVGTTAMGLSAADFTNNNDCFDVTYAVTDGWVKIEPRDISGDDGSADFAITLGANPKYNGMVQTIAVNAVTCGGLPVTYTLAGENATHAGTYTLTVKATGNFTGERSTTWEILKRAVTLTSGSASKVYDGTPLANPSVTVGGDGFIGLEGATFAVTGSQTAAGTGKNAFTYALNAGTLAGDYEITKVEGDLVVTPASIVPGDVFGGDAVETPLVCEKTYNGAAQPVEIAPNFDEPYTVLWALTDGNENAYSATAPTLRNVADGERLVYFKFVSANYAPFYGKVVFRILAKELTDEMVVLTDEAFFYDPGSTVKKPAVTVADTNALGVVISTANDYTVAYEDATSAGAIPVIVTAKNNYFGTVTKTFPVLKRPVAPPVIGPQSYNGRTQKATVTSDSRWTVVRNNGGVDVGEYEVVLRLTNTEDYRWKGVDEDESDWTGVFVIRKGANGPSREIKMDSWTYGETPSEPQGSPRNGTYTVSYRRVGADISTETTVRPELPGKYIARFWVAESENYAGYSNPNEIEFEIYPGEGYVRTYTETTPVPVPYAWLDPYLAKYGSGDYEAAGHATGANGVALWESYVAGLNPEAPTSRLMVFIEMLGYINPKITWSPDLSNAEKPRKYTVLGKAKLTDADWTPVTDANKPQMRFFKVKVEMK